MISEEDNKEKQYFLTVYTFFGKFDIVSPKPQEEVIEFFQKEVARLMSDPSDVGWKNFEQKNGKKLTINIRDIRAIAEK